MTNIKCVVVALSLGALAAVPSPAAAQVNVSVSFGARLGPEIGVFAYSQERHGDWHKNYRQWTPVMLYDVNGHYYRTNVRGARAVVVYTYNNEYFLPPQEKAWIGFDKRYDYHMQPVEEDISRARPYERPVVIDRRLGAEVGVFGFSIERAGDWRVNYKRWTPVTVYEVHGRYYEHAAPGARPVAIYRYHDEYFLPPHEKEFVGFDKRFDYQHLPNDDDRGRMRGGPERR